MAIRNRAWFIYNTSAVGIAPQFDSTNYDYIRFFPFCLTSGPQICSVYGIYDPVNFGNHPTPFSIDNDLSTYIGNALAAQAAKPSGVGQKRYVYVRTV